jgi:hypothetical protein
VNVTATIGELPEVWYRYRAVILPIVPVVNPALLIVSLIFPVYYVVASLAANHGPR